MGSASRLYTPVAIDEDVPVAQRHPARSMQVTVAFLILVTALVTATTLILQHKTAPNDTETPQASNICGTTHSSATLANCSFDPISFSWTPQPCYDDELIESFLALNDWRWYLDANATETVAFDDVMTGRYEYLYVSWNYHRWHCTYMWRKMHRAIMGRNNKTGSSLLLDTYINDPEHTDHCERVLLNRTGSLAETSTMIRRKFVECVTL